VGAGEKGVVVEEELSIRFSFSLSPEEEELPMLARDTRPFLLKGKRRRVNSSCFTNAQYHFG
jgi:hypothetical protein